jgi:hypothetical protein
MPVASRLGWTVVKDLCAEFKYLAGAAENFFAQPSEQKK